VIDLTISKYNFLMHKLIKEPQKQVVSVLADFANFIRKQNVVGLAVGIILGSSAKAVVDALVTDIFNPLIGLLMGGIDLSEQAFCLSRVGEVCQNKLAWGHFVTVLIQFVIVAAVVYVVIEKTMRFFMNEDKKK